MVIPVTVATPEALKEETETLLRLHSEANSIPRIKIHSPNKFAETLTIEDILSVDNGCTTMIGGCYTIDT